MSDNGKLNVQLHKLDIQSPIAAFPSHVDTELLHHYLMFSLEKAADEVFWMNSDSSIFYVNEAACQKLGYQREELLGMKVWDWDPLFPKEVWPTFWSELKTQKQIEFETQHMDKSGHIFPVHIKGYYYEQAGKEVLFAFVSDITEQKRKEEENEKRNQALLDYSPVCHKIIDLHFNLQYMNLNGFKMLNLPVNDEWYGKPYPFEFFPAEAKTQMEDALEWVKENKERISFESFAVDLKNTPVWLFHTLVPVLSQANELEYITVVSADITEKKKQQEVLINAQKVSLAGQLAAGICHDVNNVLNIISSNAELLSAKTQNDELSTYSERISQSISRAKGVTDRLLKLAKPKAHELSNFKLDEQIDSDIKFYLEAMPKGIRLVYSLTSKASVRVEQNTFSDSLLNLVINAQKAIASDGEIEISSWCQNYFSADADFIFCEPTASSEYAVIRVRDNGVGIPHSQLANIFEPFFSRSKGTGNTGLGLSVVSAFAVNNKCGLTVNSTPGEGTDFCLWLQTVLQEEMIEQSAQHTKESLDGLHIVIVDDEEYLLDVVSQLLQLAGASVSKHDNPISAKDYIDLHSDKVNILVTDQSMGVEMLGSDLVEWVNRCYPTIHCFISTGYSASDVLENVNATVLEKPLHSKDLIQKLSSINSDISAVEI